MTLQHGETSRRLDRIERRLDTHKHRDKVSWRQFVVVLISLAGLVLGSVTIA
jgi:hypothetical protein